jgi:hypothetical protein
VTCHLLTTKDTLENNKKEAGKHTKDNYLSALQDLRPNDQATVIISNPNFCAFCG